MSSITEKINEMVEDAIPRFALGEDFEYDTSMVLMPGPGGQPMPMIAMSFACKAMTIGEWHSGCVMMPVALPTQENIDEIVKNSVRSLLDIRAQASSQMMAESNGHKQVDPSRASSLLRP